MAETVVKTVESVDRLFSQIVVNGEVHESVNYVTPTPSQSVPQSQPAVTPEPEPSSEPASTQGEDIYGVDLNDVLHNFVDNTVPDKIQQAVKSLDVPSSGGSGKYIKSISQTDGKIETTEGNITDSVTSGSSDPVTSGAVADVLSALPTDAVLHYSFDEVPDYPVGTAVYYVNKNFVTSQFSTQRCSLTVTNGRMKAQLTSGNDCSIYNSSLLNYGNCSGKVCKARIFIHDTSTERDTALFRITFYNASNDITVTKDQWFDICFIIGTDSGASSSTPCYIGARFFSESTDNYIIFESLYIGDGSYSTPVIDNANGENNGTNNGGIAIQGVSGKGVYFLSGKYAQCDFNLTPNFTVSVWVNPSDNASGKSRNIVHKTNQLILRNGASFGNYLQVYLYGDSSTLLSGADFGSLLPPNVWTHVVIVRNNLEFSMYKNGVKVRTIALADNTLRQNTEKFKVSNEVNTGSQSVDDLLVFNRALSETEVLALYLNRGNTPKYYNLNDYRLHNEQGAFVRNLGAVTTYTFTMPKVNKYRMLKGIFIGGSNRTMGFEVTYGYGQDNKMSIPDIMSLSDKLTMSYDRTACTITFTTSTEVFYAVAYAIQDTETFLGVTYY